MQPYILNSFRRSSDGAIFTRVETGTNLGGYVYLQEVKRLRDFICDGNFNIHSVAKSITITRNEIFTIGDRVNESYGGRNLISKIIIENSEVICFLHPTDIQSRFRLVNITKYTEPVTVVIPEPIRRGPGRPSNAEIAARNTTTPNNHFDALEARIMTMNPRPIRLEKTLIRTVRKLTLKDFLIKFFKEWNAEKTTIYVDDKATQTTVGRRRSLGDIYMICKYYYPECTLNEVLNLLYNVLPTVITVGFRTSFCSTIRKQVWYYAQNSPNMTINTGHNDEYGNISTFYTNNITA